MSVVHSNICKYIWKGNLPNYRKQFIMQPLGTNKNFTGVVFKYQNNNDSGDQTVLNFTE